MIMCNKLCKNSDNNNNVYTEVLINRAKSTHSASNVNIFKYVENFIRKADYLRQLTDLYNYIGLATQLLCVPVLKNHKNALMIHFT